MSIIRKLIFVEWFKVFFVAVIILATLVSVADLISGFLRGSVTPTQVIINHLIEYPTYLTQIFPVACLVASLFSINKLKNRNELTAIFASGFGRIKFFWTIFQASCIVAIVQFFLSAYFQPLIKTYRYDLLGDAQERFSNLESRGLKASTIGSGKIWYKSGNYFVSFAQFEKSKNQLNDVTLFFIEDAKISKKVVAPYIIYNDQGEWILGENSFIYDQLNKLNYPDMVAAAGQRVALQESPFDFAQLESDITTLNIIALWGYISQLKRSGLSVGEYMVMFLNHFASTLICIIFALLASVAVFRPNRRGSSFGKGLAFVFIFTLVYWLVSSYFTEMGTNGDLNPWIASFFVPSIFLFFMLLFFIYHRKLR